MAARAAGRSTRLDCAWLAGDNRWKDSLPMTTTYGKPPDGLDLHGGPGNEPVTIFNCTGP